jgi:hypothetical protein
LYFIFKHATNARRWFGGFLCSRLAFNTLLKNRRERRGEERRGEERRGEERRGEERRGEERRGEERRRKQTSFVGSLGVSCRCSFCRLFGLGSICKSGGFLGFRGSSSFRRLSLLGSLGLGSLFEGSRGGSRLGLLLLFYHTFKFLLNDSSSLGLYVGEAGGLCSGNFFLDVGGLNSR